MAAPNVGNDNHELAIWEAIYQACVDRGLIEDTSIFGPIVAYPSIQTDAVGSDTCRATVSVVVPSKIQDNQ